MMNNPTGRVDRSRDRRNTPEYDAARDRYNKSLQASIERREKRRAAENEAGYRSSLSAQEAAQQARRDKQQQLYEQANTGQRAYYSANAAADDFARTQQLNKQQQKGVLKRDELQNSAVMQRDSQQARDQRLRDQQQFGYKTQENDQQFGHQVYRDQLQHGNTMQRDQQQHGNTLERDITQFGLDTRREDQQQQNTLERDYTQFGLNSQRDQMQNQFQAERDNRLNMFDVNREARQQQYQQQNQYQRETAEVSARWQEQIQQARNMGMDFSAQQKKEMADLDKAFRKNVLNGYLEEGLKQQAMLEHQKKLSEFIPEERVQNPQDGLNQSLIFHEPTKTWFMQTPDARGNRTFEPLGNGDGGQAEQQKMMQLQQEKERQLADKKAEMIRKAKFDRDNEFMEIVREKQNATNDLGQPIFKDRNEALKSAMDEYAPREQLWRQEYGLPPLYAFQEESDQVRKKQAPPDNGNPFRKPQSAPVPVQQQPTPFRPTTGPQKPIEMSSTNIDSHMQKTMESGDTEAAAALQTVKLISAKNNGGPPPAGSQDLMDMVKALKFLRSKGIAIQGEAGKPQGTASKPSGTQILFDAGWR